MALSDLEIDQLKQEIDDANEYVWSMRAVSKEGYYPEKIIAETLAKAQQINYQLGIAQCLLNEGRGAFILNHEYELSEKLINQSIEIFQVENNIKWESNALLAQAIFKNSAGKPDSALYLGLKGMEYFKSRPEEEDHVMACYVVGTIYKDLGKLEEAEVYFKLGIKQKKIYNSWDARLYAGLSNIYTTKKNYNAALTFGEKGLEMLRLENNVVGISRALNDLGLVYFHLKNYDKALEYIFEALRIRKENNFKHFLLGSLIDIATIYCAMKKPLEALPFYLEAEPLAVETMHDDRHAKILKGLAEIYKITKDYKKSVECYEQFVLVRQKINAQEKELNITQSESKLIKEKEDEIERLKNVELKNAYDLIAEKNKEINDSINYAERLQRSLMASDTLLQQNLKDYFIYFNPKEAVSGDFYWASYIKTSDAEGAANFALVCADSTGHGVPGAIMSMMNMNSLKEAIKEGCNSSDKILNHTRKIIIETLANDGSAEGGRDGMDAALVILNEQKNTLQFSLANNPLWLIRKGELIEYKPDKMPVGKHDNQKNPFTKHEIILEKGDLIYLITDGYADQFGGPHKKKFKSSALKSLLLENAKKTMAEQKSILDDNFQQWRQNLEQVDDVCIIGIRV